jgi:hypothetical protein
MIEIRFDKTKDEVALLIWFLVDHSVFHSWNNQPNYTLALEMICFNIQALKW